MKRGLQFNIVHLLMLGAVVAIAMGYLSWSGYFSRDGVWDVTAIAELESWSHGEDAATGQPLFWCDVEYSATCRDGDRVVVISLGTFSALGGPVQSGSRSHLPLREGNSFRFAESTGESGAIQLPDSKFVVKTE